MGLFDKIKGATEGIFSKKHTNETNESIAFCAKCGAPLQKGACFCSKCGSAIDNYGKPIADNKRASEYIGRILKCPNCGATITETTAICPDCGIKITRQSTVGSVQKFKEEIMQIEKGRSKGIRGLLGLADETTDSQILTLVRNFPVPNSIDDILEFVLLAVANIDVDLSKQSFSNKVFGGGDKAKISNAWVSKMQQAYQKAELTFADEPIFKKIQKIYFEKMKELKIKITD